MPVNYIAWAQSLCDNEPNFIAKDGVLLTESNCKDRESVAQRVIEAKLKSRKIAFTHEYSIYYKWNWIAVEIKTSETDASGRRAGFVVAIEEPAKPHQVELIRNAIIHFSGLIDWSIDEDLVQQVAMSLSSYLERSGQISETPRWYKIISALSKALGEPDEHQEPIDDEEISNCD